MRDILNTAAGRATTAGVAGAVVIVVIVIAKVRLGRLQSGLQVQGMAVVIQATAA